MLRCPHSLAALRRPAGDGQAPWWTQVAVPWLEPEFRPWLGPSSVIVALQKISLTPRGPVLICWRMSESKTQSNPFLNVFGPQELLSQRQHAMTQWADSAREQLDHWVGTAEQIEGWQREGMQRAGEATEEVAKLMRTGIEYGGRLAEQWRSTSVEAVRRTIDLVTPPKAA